MIYRKEEIYSILEEINKTKNELVENENSLNKELSIMANRLKNIVDHSYYEYKNNIENERKPIKVVGNNIFEQLQNMNKYIALQWNEIEKVGKKTDKLVDGLVRNNYRIDPENNRIFSVQENSYQNAYYLYDKLLNLRYKIRNYINNYNKRNFPNFIYLKAPTMEEKYGKIIGRSSFERVHKLRYILNKAKNDHDKEMEEILQNLKD